MPTWYIVIALCCNGTGQHEVIRVQDQLFEWNDCRAEARAIHFAFLLNHDRRSFVHCEQMEPK